VPECSCYRASEVGGDPQVGGDPCSRLRPQDRTSRFPRLRRPGVAPLESIDGATVLVFPADAGFSLKKIANNISLVRDAITFVTGNDLPVLLVHADG
jgi:hypothetical protein